MLSPQQQQLVQAIVQLDSQQVTHLLSSGLDPNFLTPDGGPPISLICDQLYSWWEQVCEAHENNRPLTPELKQSLLNPYQSIIDALIHAKANLHLWDAEEFYGPLWDAASAACVPVVLRLLDEGVDPNRLDDEGLTILSSISQLWFDCDYDQIDWSEAWPEERETLELLRERGAKMTGE
jgi:hypothetical protein